MPEHNFLLMSKAEYEYNEAYRALTSFGGNNVRAKAHQIVDFDDDVFEYIKDTLNWIPTKNPSRRNIKRETGLDQFGITVIDSEGAAIAQSIMLSWLNLFLLAPEKIKLQGLYVMTGGYEKIEIDRDKLTNSFKDLVNLLDGIIQKPQDFYILHLGI